MQSDPLPQAAIYARISRDKEGAGLGVERQIDDCRELAAQHGYDDPIVITDNDISAYSGKRRPGYEHLLSLIGSGEVATVFAWHTDRLHRRTIELEAYIEACDPRGVSTYTVKAGHVDLATPAGRAIARTLGAWARYEVETSTGRVKAAKLQAAKAGKWAGGQRPFGWEPACVALRESEAAVVREMPERLIDGESFNRIALDLNARKVTTANGKLWSALKVRNVLLRKRNCGIRAHLGEEYEAAWPAIYSRERHEEVLQAMAESRSRYKQRGPARKFLLTGFAYCGRCGMRMNTAPRSHGYSSSYVCRKDRPERQEYGCGRMRRSVEAVDMLITECILVRLESAALGNALRAQSDGGDELKTLQRQYVSQRRRLEEIRADYASGDTERTEYRLLRDAALLGLEQLRHELARKTEFSSLGQLPVGDIAREAWEAADLKWRRQVVDLLIERVVINPSNTSGMKKTDYFMGQMRFKPEDVEVRWRV
jgi:DNA invertase Pin-like site-specific DNA recombinase